MRHSAAHVLAEAMVELMPDAELGIGPPIDTGFYYDFRLPRAARRRRPALARRAHAASPSPGKHPFVMSSLTKAEAEERWANQPFKLDLLRTSKRATSRSARTPTSPTSAAAAT